MADSGTGDGGNRRPTPVRVVMDPAEESPEDRGGETRTFEDPTSGESWVAQVSGRTMSGVMPLRTIPLMDVEFFEASDPGVPLRRILCLGESLDELEEDGLLELFRSSEPFDPRAPKAPPQGRRERKQRPRRRS